MKAVHLIQLVCAALAVGLPQAESAFPPSLMPVFRASAAVCVLVSSVLGAVSPAMTLSAAAPK